MAQTTNANESQERSSSVSVLFDGHSKWTRPALIHGEMLWCVWREDKVLYRGDLGEGAHASARESEARKSFGIRSLARERTRTSVEAGGGANRLSPGKNVPLLRGFPPLCRLRAMFEPKFGPSELERTAEGGMIPQRRADGPESLTTTTKRHQALLRLLPRRLPRPRAFFFFPPGLAHHFFPCVFLFISSPPPPGRRVVVVGIALLDAAGKGTR